MAPTSTSSFRAARLVAVPAIALLVAAGCAADTSDSGDDATATGQASPASTPDETAADTDTAAEPAGPAPTGFTPEEVTTLNNPWAMAFLPDGRALITLKSGSIVIVDPETGETTDVSGVPDVVDRGQGGLGDIILAPSFDQDGAVYLSWVESGGGGTGAVVGKGTLELGDSPALTGLETIWEQEPKQSSNGHFAHRLAISPDDRYLFVTSGDRQEMSPAQDLSNNLGSVLRLNLDGTAADGNPFADRGGVSAEVWSYGHRNPLGLAFAPDGTLWSSEMGPKGGDELNLIERGANYGWPEASNGSHYSGRDIPDHQAGDGFEAPKVYWTPSISPGGLMIYSGDVFTDWRGDAFLPALSGQALIRVDLDGTNATEAQTWDLGERIREVEQAPDGSIYLLEDGRGARMLKLTPEFE